MKKIGITAIATLITLGLWTVLVFVGVSEGWDKSPIATTASPVSFVEAAQEIVESEHVGNLSFVLIENGEVSGEFNFSSGDTVDGRSVYQVASLGKWLTAWGVMSLVDDGSIDLDAPISDYVTRWALPTSEFNTDGVTVRRLLSHMAGLDDGLGYDGFDDQADVQTLEASLSQALDASPGNSGVVKLGHEPGSQWQYSGGGYTLLQLLIEEVSGQSFSAFMSERIFVPLGMERTTFDHQEALALGLAANFDLVGQTEPFKWYTALAATSLFTTASDLAVFIQAQGPNGGQSVLSEESIALIGTPHARQFGADIWGLGVILYTPNDHGQFILGHDGSNGPAINTAARLDPNTGDGIVVLETGSSFLASQLASEWVFWKTGRVDNILFAARIDAMLMLIAIGGPFILLGGVIVGWRWQLKPSST
ncbi:MAG: serine hydrolase domain-containing protein [Pseudomonadota bacterium]